MVSELEFNRNVMRLIEQKSLCTKLKRKRTGNLFTQVPIVSLSFV